LTPGDAPLTVPSQYLQFDTNGVLILSDVDANGANVKLYVNQWGTISTSASILGHVIIKKSSDPSIFVIYSISNPISIESGQTEFASALLSSNGTLVGNDFVNITWHETG